MDSDLKDTMIGDVMTSVPYTIGAEQTARKAREMMREHNVRHLPVQKGGELVGIVSDRDIHFALAVDLKRDDELTLDAIYTPEPVVVGPKTKIANVLKKMVSDQLGCILIEDKGKLVGIYTVTDACRDFHAALETGSIRVRNS